MTNYIQESVVDQNEKEEKSVVKNAEKACIMKSEDEQFLNDNLINEFIIDAAIAENKDKEKNGEADNDSNNEYIIEKENSEKKSK